MISARDKELITAASAWLDKRQNPPVHSTAAALRTASGEVFLSLNVDHFSGFVCAETAALSEALNYGVYSFDTIVAFRKTEDGQNAIANPCGKCRQILFDYAPDLRVIVDNDGKTIVKKINDLLPYASVEQQGKIQAVITKGASS